MQSGIDPSHFGRLCNPCDSHALSSNSSAYIRSLCYCYDFHESRRHDTLHAIINLVDIPEERLEPLDPLEI